ncbi:hypothetical protein Lal_00006343 [Lupinus albus]|uniref:Putative transcription factor WRKY family n=1 Tax=Lupinus albus TaxID=3870 RepID=A0A6A4Q895_LUPAL|nr:putative transcription factor WRKY family [Lupinus albus]KAF1875713.1 hypothetical protein Lal_00006343 [Lupinus albus]
MEEKREKEEVNPMANSIAAPFSEEILNMTTSNNTFIFPFSSTIFDMIQPASSCDQKPSSSSFDTGFMDLLAVHDYNPFLFDSIPTTTTQIDHYHLPSPAEGCEVLNTPASPNSTSISSSSNEATVVDANNINEYHSGKAGNEAEDEDGDGGKTKKQLKPKKKKQKKQREPRFAFMTKSEVDQLDDGYRWRKYGQKAVKNSPYPRSYYRCTTVGCGVKKRVERSSEDPTTVVTTYEGQHTHPCPATSRASLSFMQYGNGGSLGSHHFMLPHHQQQQQQQEQFRQAFTCDSTTLPLNSNSNFVNSSSFNSFSQDQKDHHQGLAPSRMTVLRDNGLLQDIVPTQMRNEKKEDE